MELSNADILKLLPVIMRDDEAVKALSNGVNPLIHAFFTESSRLKTWDRIESLRDSELDELAWELNIEWYHDTADRETKVKLIKESDLVYSRLGTKWAVEQVISTYFGSGKVLEWYEYGGKPFHFKVLSGNPSITNESLDEFIEILNIVKRKSAWLESILITLTGQMNLYVGVCYVDRTKSVHRLGPETLT